MITPLPLAFIVSLSVGAVGLFFHVIIGILATIKVIQETKGAAVPIWLVFIWFLAPCVGGLLALIAIRREPRGMDP